MISAISFCFSFSYLFIFSLIFNQLEKSDLPKQIQKTKRTYAPAARPLNLEADGTRENLKTAPPDHFQISLQIKIIFQ
jgi:hypothetical protein